MGFQLQALGAIHITPTSIDIATPRIDIVPLSVDIALMSIRFTRCELTSPRCALTSARCNRPLDSCRLCFVLRIWHLRAAAHRPDQTLKARRPGIPPGAPDITLFRDRPRL